MRVGIVFPGQGSQYVGMGKKLYDRYNCVKKIYNEANEILGYDLQNLCFYGDSKILQQSKYTQPAVFTTSYAAYIAFIDEYGIKPVCLAGHSMGEITALVCANAIDFRQGLRMINQRGNIMQESAGELGGMHAVINMKSIELEYECKKVSNACDYVTISNYNHSNQHTISGSFSALEKVIPAIKDKGGITVPLKVSGPFHSMYMMKSAEDFCECLKSYTFKIPDYAVISNYTGKEYESSTDLKESLVKQIYSPVLWESCVWSMLEYDVDIILELGPKNVLTKLIRQQTDQVRIYASDQDKELSEFYKDFGNDNETYVNDASRMDSLVRQCLKNAICIRNAGEDDLEYERMFRIPYSDIKMKYLMYKDKNEIIPYEIAKNAVNMLKTACRVKRVSKEVEEKLFANLIMDTGAKSLILEQIQL